MVMSDIGSFLFHVTSTILQDGLLSHILKLHLMYTYVQLTSSVVTR